MAEPAEAPGAELVEALFQPRHSSRYQENFLNISPISTIQLKVQILTEKKNFLVICENNQPGQDEPLQF